MPDGLPVSEFGGKPGKTGVQPFPHVATVPERLMQLYRTGIEEGAGSDVVVPEVFDGLLPLPEITEIRKAEGVLAKGQVWDEIIAGGGS